MEGKNNQNDSSSSSSFVSELFGSKEAHPPFSSSGVFGSKFSSQSPNVLGKGSILGTSEVSEKSIKETWDSILGTHDHISKGYGGHEYQKTQIKDKNSIYEHQRIEPCNLSSSIFYGGQDIIYQAHSTQNEGRNSLPKNDGGKDDLEIATRGDWWKGGLYY